MGCHGTGRPRRVFGVDGHPPPSSCKSKMTLMVPFPEPGALNWRARAGRASRVARSHVLHLRPLSCVGPLRHLPLFTPPPRIFSLPPCPPPPRRIASGTCSPPSDLSTPHPLVWEVLRGIGGEGRGERRAREAVSARVRPPVVQGRPRRARPRCAVPPLARRVARRAPARRLPRIAWSARLAAPLPRPSILQ